MPSFLDQLGSKANDIKVNAAIKELENRKATIVKSAHKEIEAIFSAIYDEKQAPSAFNLPPP